MVIDTNEVKNEFEKYILNYDISNPKIKLKVDHIYRVAENSKKIAKNLGLTDEEISLAETIGFLHDIGRFEQVKKYNTFIDSNSVNHAEEGLNVLFKDNFIRKFVKDNKYDNIIFKSILNHNKFNIDENLSEKEKVQVNIIRDADKIDIFKVVTTEKLENTTSFDKIEIPKYIITDEIYKEFNNKELVKYSNINNCLDYMVAWTAYIYDINYKESLKIIKEKNYIDDIFKMADNSNEVAKKQIHNIKEKANLYIENKIGTI